MAQLFKNNARAALTAGISNSATTITIDPARADLFPIANTDAAAISLAADWFKATLQNTTGAVEIIYVRTRTLGSGVLSNVLRAQEGTAALTFIAGDICSLRMTAVDVGNAAEFGNTASAYGKTLIAAAAAAAARVVLGVTSIGEALFTSANAAAARTTLGATTVGGEVFTAVDAAAARTALGAAPRAARIDVASAATLDLTANAPDTDDIRLTGTAEVTLVTIAVGRVVRVVAGGASSFANNANIVTQAGATLQLAAGDTLMLRATAANVVEVLNYVLASGVVLLTGNQTIAGVKTFNSAVTMGSASMPTPSGSAPIYGARAWCVFDGTVAGTNAPTAGGNVSTVQRTSDGVYLIAFTTEMPDALYNAVVTCQYLLGSGGRNNLPSAEAISKTTLRVRCHDASSGVAIDQKIVSVTVFR